MALFGRNKKEETKTAPKPKKGVTAKATEAKQVPAGLNDRNVSGVFLKPRITEKAVGLSDKNVYTFEIRRDANKHDVRAAVKQLFNVEPRKIAIVNKQPRPFVSRMRGRRGVHPGMKKVYVYLKEGDRIDLV